MSENQVTKKTFDVTLLAQYTKKIRELGTINKMMAPQYLQSFIEAMDVASTMLSTAIHADLKAEAALKTAESIAYLDRAGDILKAKGMKDSAESRKMCMALDPDVQVAKNEKARTEALVCFLKNKVQEFRSAHDDVRKFAYGDSYMTPHEGM